MKLAKSKINLIDTIVFFIGFSIASWLFFREAFGFIAGFTAILSVMYLIIVWDDIVIWWSTKN